MTIRFFYPDGRTEVTDGQKVADFSLSVRTGCDGVTEVTLTPEKDGISLSSVECEFPLPPELTGTGKLLVYDNHAFTNDTTDTVDYSTDTSMTTGELFVLKNPENGLVCLCGFVTALRFWSSVTLREGKAVFRTDLEERPLRKGEAYRLEKIMFTGCSDREERLLEAYGDAVSRHMNAVPTGDLPTGWCSWSCYYNGVDEEKIRRAADGQERYTLSGQANLIQIDDGWQRGDSFPGDFWTDPVKFPEGMRATSEYVTRKGMTFGLWLSPFLIDDRSEFYDELKAFVSEEVTLIEHCHPFELGDPRFLTHLRKVFTRMTKEYGAKYFKLDFLAASIRYFTGKENDGKPVRFRDGFCVELLRKALSVIRETVGPDVFLLSCGAPTLLGAGICNGARMSCDIIWGKYAGCPSYWEIMRNCIGTVCRRYFYHRRVYVNDPDGLVLRDEDTGDGYNSTWAEAQLWSIAVAMSGGSVLSNDELENLSPARRRLYTRLLPPLGIPGHPVDFFETPSPTSCVVDYSEQVKFLALYNLEDKMQDISFDLSRIGMDGAFVVDCLSDTVYGITDRIEVRNANPHSGAMFLLRKTTDKPEFAFADCDIYGGVHRVSVCFDREIPEVQAPDGTKVYILCPDSSAVQGEETWSGNGYKVIRLD